MSNLNSSFVVTRDDGSEYFAFGDIRMPGLNAERLGELTGLMADVRKAAKSKHGTGDLTLTLKATIDGVSIPDEVVTLDSKNLLDVEDAMFDGFKKMTANERARRAKKDKK